MSNHRAVLVLSCFLLATLQGGCQRSSVDRLPIHGTVQTASGQKFDASISFQPMDGKRPVANGSVKNGEYWFDRNNGPTAGPTRVFVRRIVHRGEEMAWLDKSKGKISPKPGPSANFEWTQAADVKDDGKYIHDFTLKD
jgi:hypothetical protein